MPLRARTLPRARGLFYSLAVPIALDEGAVVARLRPLADDATFRRGIETFTNEPRFLALFLMGVSQGEALGEAGVAAIGQEEIAGLMHELRRQGLEEHGHSEGSRLAAQELFPECFDSEAFRWSEHVPGLDYYFTVREANRRRLRERDRYSRLNLYLTTSFGFEVMVELLYGAVIDALVRSPLPRVVRERVTFVLTVILRQEETHLGLIAQHNALLAADRSRLSPPALEALERLGRLEATDYEWVAELAVRNVVRLYAGYADAEKLRAALPAS
jgi:hypothetical protein